MNILSLEFESGLIGGAGRKTGDREKKKNKRIQAQKNKYRMSHFCEMSGIDKSTETKNGSEVVGAELWRM